MKFLNDLLPVLTKHTLTFVEKNYEIEDVHTFKFKTDREYKWKPGQHGLFIVPDKKVKGGSFRGFSIASHPEEKIIMISSRISDKPSDFKKALLNLKQGDTIIMRGPFGPFYVDDPTKPFVGIAGGIGITPFRSIFGDVVKNKAFAKTSINLLYSDNRNTYVYKDYFSDMQKEHKLMNIKYIADKEVLINEMKALTGKFNNAAVYYISGSPGMIKDLKRQLIDQGINKANIRHEKFFGY
jgi:ferredoxin-NADP reductase